MTVNELIKQVDILYYETITEGQAIAWVNECQQSDLMADCLIFNDTSISATANAWVDLPADFLRVNYIEDGNGKKYIGNFEILPEIRKIKFPCTDTYTIYYYAIPKTVTSGNDTPEAHVSLHYAMVHYLYAKYQFRENGPDDIKGNKAMNDYAMYRNNVLAGLKRMATAGQQAGVVR